MNLFKLWGEIGVRNTDAIQAIDETTGHAEGAESKMSAAFKKIGAAVTTYFAVDKIIDFGKEIVNVAAEVSAEASAFDQIMGDYASQASEKVAQIADATGMVSTRLTPYMTSMTAKFKGLGYDIDDATSYASRGLNLAADAAAFWDKSLDESMSHLNSFINGSYEGGEAIGLFANDTQMAAYAVSQGIVAQTKDWAALDEAIKQATRLEYAENMFAMSGATGQAAKEAGQYANVQANLTEKWRQFKAQIGEPLLQNVVLPAMEKLSGLVDKASTAFQDLSVWVANNKEELNQAVTTIGKLAEIAVYATGVFVAFKAAMMIQKVVQGFQGAQVALSLLSMEIGSANLAQAALNGTLTIGETIVGLLTGKIKLATLAQGLMTKAQAALNAVMKANTIALIITGIAALVAAFIYLWNNCEWFRNFWIGLWNGIKSIAASVADWLKQAWTDIGNFFTSTVPGWFESFKTFFVNLWEGISSFFSGVWEGIKNVVQVAIMLIGSILNAAFQIITLPWRFIWENCGEYIIAAWEWIKSTVSNAVNAVKDFIVNAWTAISTALSPILEAIKTAIKTAWNAIKKTVTTVVNAIKTVVTTVWNAIKSAVTTVLNAIKNVVTSVWNGIKSTITSVINAIKSTVSTVFNAIKTAISTPLNAAKSTVTSIFDGIKSTITDKINGAKTVVQNGLNAIKGFFDNLKLKLPDIKLPHFNIVGSFSLNPPSVPKLSIDWYAKGGIMNEPTLFDYNPKTGKAKVGGEAGSEAIAPIDTLLGYVRTAVQEENSNLNYYLEKLISMLAEYLPEIISGSNRQLVLDTGILVGELAPQMDSRLGDINELRKRGR